MKHGQLHALLLCAAVLVFFHPVLGFPFLSWDDEANVTDNPHVTAGTLAGLGQLWREPYASLYVPAAYTWFWLLARVSRFVTPGAAFDPHVFHAGNLILHALCVLLVYRIVSRLVSSPRAAFVGALAFALHPLVSEPVAWISEARGLLSALLAFAALDLWLAVAVGEARGSPVRATWRFALAVVCFCAAMLAKPQAAALPLVVLILDRWIVGRPWKRALPVFATGCVLALVAFVITRSVQGDDALREVAPLWARPLVALDALGFYTWKALGPTGLATDYGRMPAWLLDAPVRAWPAVIPVVLAALLFLARRARPYLPAYALFAAALLPVLGLVPFAYQDVSTVADRYAYPALIGLALAVALLLDRASAAVQWAAAAVLAAVLGTMAAAQADTWRSNEALFARVLEVNPRSFKAHGNLGIAAARVKRHDEAVAHYRRALELGPPRWIVYQHLGLALLAQGKLEESAQAFAQSLELRPDNPPVALLLGTVRLRQGQYAEAEPHLRAALAHEPKNAEVREWLATTVLAQGRQAEAIELFREALRSRDTPEMRMNLAQALMLEGDARGAIAEMRLVLAAKPTWPDAMIDLAWLLATSPDDALRNGEEALSLATRARAGEPEAPTRYLDVLAAALAAAGRFEEAAKTAERAIAREGGPGEGYAGRIEKRRQAYARGEDWRDLVR